MLMILLVLILNFLVSGISLSPEDDNDILPFPLAMPTSIQVEEAQTCQFDVTQLPDDMGNYDPVTACEWATVALFNLEGVRGNYRLPEAARYAYRRAIELNPAIALVRPIYDGFLFRLDHIIARPDALESSLKSITLEGRFVDSGLYARYWISIQRNGDTYYATGSGRTNLAVHGYDLHSDEFESPLSWDNVPVNPDRINTISQSFYNFIRVAVPIEADICEDYIVDQRLTLTFNDGTELQLFTNSSTVFLLGGPWQMIIDDRTYIQVDSSLPLAVLDELVHPLGIPGPPQVSLRCDSDYDLIALAFARDVGSEVSD
jgi:hypothetical protein